MAFPFTAREVLTAASLNAALTTAAITGGVINGATIGQTTPAAGAFTTLVGATLTASGGTINGATIGQTTPAAGAFTTLSSSGLATLASVAVSGGAIDGTTIGATTKAAGTFSTLVVGAASSSGSAIFYGPLSGSGRALYVTQALTLSGSTAGNVARFETALSGSTTGQPGIFTFTSSDNLQAANGVNWRITSLNYGGALFQGPRNGEWINVNSTADCTNYGDAYLVALAPWWRANHYHNGYPGAERGSIWGLNPLGWLGNSGTIGARRMRGVQAIETDVGAVYNTFYRTNVRFAEWGAEGYTSAGVGRWQDSHASFSRMPDRGLPGMRTLLNLGDVLGHWPMQATGATFCEPVVSQVAADPTNSFAVGFMWPQVTFDYAPWWTPGAFIGGTGHIGGNTVGGTVLQTVSTVLAKTAAVASVAVARGGLHRVKPTLTCSAPPGGGTTATLTVATMGIDDVLGMTGVYGARGTGYVVGDVLTLSGGTFTTAGQYTVSAVDSSGQIIDMDPTTVGSYSVLPTYPVTLTGGSGSGATCAPYWTILTVSVSGAGSGYAEQVPPTITVSGANSDQFQRPLLIPVMTATQGQLALNNGKINVAGMPTSASGLSSGDVWNNGGVLTVV